MEDSMKSSLQQLSEVLDKNLPEPARVPSRNLTPSVTGLGIIGSILQHPTQFFQEIQQRVKLSQKIVSLFVTSLLFLTIYGGVLGVGHPRLSFGAAVAVPFLFIGSLVTCLPVMYLLDVLTGSQRSFGQTVTVILTSTCVAATVFFSFSPIMMVFRLTGTIVQFFFLNLGIMALAALVGLIFVAQGLIQTAIVDPNHNLSGVNRGLHFLWMLVYLMVIVQLGQGMLAFFEETGGFFGYF